MRTFSGMRGSRVLGCLSVLALIGPMTIAWAVEAPTATVLQNPPGTEDRVTGAAEAGSTVRVYGDLSLSSTIASGVVTNGTFNLGIGDNVYPVVYVTATDAGSQSAATTRTNDIAAPHAPTVLVTQNPPGTADRVSGTAESGSIVRVHANSSAGAVIASGAATAGDGAYSFDIGDNAYAVVVVTATDIAGNTGPSADAANDIVAPAIPTVWVMQNPPGTSDRAQGNTEAVARVRVWTDSSRSTLIVTGLAANGTLDLAIRDNLHALVFVTATDVAANESAGVTATNDIIAPAAPSATV